MNWTYFWAVLGALVVFGALAFQLLFDWRKEPALKARHIGLVVWGLGGVLVALMTARTQARDSKETTKQLDTCNAASTECNTKVTQLSQAVKTGEEEARRNAEVQQTTFVAFGEKLGRVEGELTSEHQKREIADLRKQLVIANAPKPRAVLEASFATNDKSSFPIKETWAVRKDGVVKFDLMVVNTTDVMAETGAIWIRLCQACSFAKEPPGSEKPTGSPEADRDIKFYRIGPGTGLQTIPVEAAVPAFVQRMEVDMFGKCDTCVPESSTKLFVNVVD
jgi:hypothetical protein